MEVGDQKRQEDEERNNTPIANRMFFLIKQKRGVRPQNKNVQDEFGNETKM